jgi:hypothetical protein
MHQVHWFNVVKKVPPTGATKQKNKEHTMATYTFKHPITKQWIDIIADSFHEARAKLKAMIGDA